MATKAATKTRVTKKQVIAHRTRAVKDTSPVWEGCETWDENTFHRHSSMTLPKGRNAILSAAIFICVLMTAPVLGRAARASPMLAR